MTTQSNDPRYEVFLHGFVAARDPKNPGDTLLSLQEAEPAWASYCANKGLSVNLEGGTAAINALLGYLLREAFSQYEVFVHGFIAARAAKVQRLSLLALDEAETAWRVHLDHTETASHV